MNADDPPFGALTPSLLQATIRRMTGTLPDGYFSKRAASLAMKLVRARSGRAFDVPVFGDQRARLYPADNHCERRVFATPQFWEAGERAALASEIAAFTGAMFIFVDVGANAGLYTLFARSEARRRGLGFRVLCIEAAAEMRRRLDFNLKASGADQEAIIAPFAASDSERLLQFEVNEKSRGMSQISDAGHTTVAAKPLLKLVREAGFSKIDALKIDVEGHEYPILAAFFRDAPQLLAPTVILMETSHETGGRSALALVEEAGYRVKFQSASNVLVTRDGV